MFCILVVYIKIIFSMKKKDQIMKKTNWVHAREGEMETGAMIE